MTDDEIIHRIREQDAPGELPPPAPPEVVAELEAAVGHAMPPLLKRDPSRSRGRGVRSLG
ncbi:hypothetical protein [Streptomyces sp. NPDC001536]|uniref:hypothetical protein n=1 Tax=Streptomyces sp. NPDC001536 TaxID=3364583 RepID=UPI00367771F4